MALTRDQVVGSAVGILTEFGLADLSMRRLARELEVQVGALYWHVKNKQDLLVDVAARLLGGITLPPLAGTSPPGESAASRTAIIEMATAIRAALLPVPDSADVVQLAQSLQPAALLPLTGLRDLLETAGIDPAHSAWAQHLILNHILGSVAAGQEYAKLAALAAADPSIPGGPQLGTDAFAWGLDVILDGAFPAREASNA